MKGSLEATKVMIKLDLTIAEGLNISRAIEKIMEQREEIVDAFIAQYGVTPDRMQQVLEFNEKGILWYLKVREEEK